METNGNNTQLPQLERIAKLYAELLRIENRVEEITEDLKRIKERPMEYIECSPTFDAWADLNAYFAKITDLTEEFTVLHDRKERVKYLLDLYEMEELTNANHE